jgi:DMSO reductase anchor subunit
MGWRTSWFSREVLAFAWFLPCAAQSAFLAGSSFTAWKPVELLRQLPDLCAAASGLAAVWCSAMIYVSTGREFWGAWNTFVRFFGTVLLLGLATAFCWTASGWFAMGLVWTAAVKLAVEGRIFRDRVDEETPEPGPLNRSAWLLSGLLSLRWRARVACVGLGGAVLPLLLMVATETGPAPGTGWRVLCWSLCMAGELLERHLFFAGVSPARMPGGAA